MPLHITMRQLQVFEAVARRLSFTRAAKELHLTQPAVSMQVKQLESMLELPLFEVLGKKVYLTEAGRTMLRHSRTMMSHLVEIEHDIHNLRGIDGGTLNLCIAATVNYFATRLLAKFCAKHQTVQINLDISNREQLLKRLAANEPDLVLMGQPPPGLDVRARAFMENPLIVIANPRHRLAGEQKIPIEAVENETFVMREPGCETRTVMQQVFEQHGVALNPGMEMSTNEAIKQSVAAGFGLAVVSAHTVELELNAGHLVSLDLKHFPIMRKWYVVHRKGKRLSQTMAVFVQFVIEEGRKTRHPRRQKDSG